MEGVHNNSKQVEHVLNEVMNDDELVKDVNCISLKERPTKDVEGDESTLNTSFEKKIPPQDEGWNEPQQDGQKKKAPKTM